MKIYKQRNVYYLDLKKQILSGYTEIHVRREYKENRFTFRCCCLTITSAKILAGNGIELEPKWVSKGRPAAKEESDGFELQIPKTFKLSTFVLRVLYEKEKDSPGVIYYEPVGKNDEHREMVVYDAVYSAPYMEQITDIEMIYVMPNNRNIEIASSGKFVSFSEKENSLIYAYESRMTCPSSIKFALGTYQAQSFLEEGTLYTPGNFDLFLDEFVGDMQNIIRYMNCYSELPVPTVVFTLCPFLSLTGRNLIVLNLSSLGRSRDIEMNFGLKETLCDLLAEQMFMFFNHSLVDSWIFQGLSGYLADMALRFLMGHNTFLFRYSEDKEFVIENDVVEPPLFYSERRKFDYKSHFFRAKSKLVFHTLHNQLSGAFVKKMILAVTRAKQNEFRNNTVETRRSRPPVHAEQSHQSHSSSSRITVRITKSVKFQKVIKIELPKKRQPLVAVRGQETGIEELIGLEEPQAEDEGCFTPFFIKIIKDSSGKDMKSFFDFYVFNAGLVVIDLNVRLNTKKGRVVIETKQTSTTRLKTANTAHYSFVKIKSVETDGTFNQKILLNGQNSYAIHKKAEGGTVLFIRADCKREILGRIRVNQPEALYVEQLLDKNVTGQLEGVDFFRNNTSSKAIDVLERVAENPHTFHQVKNRIYGILANVFTRTYDPVDETESKYNGLMRLIQMFIKLRCVPNSTIVKNTEMGILNFLIQKSLVKKITDFHTDQNETADGTSNVSVVVAFLNNIINYNDTTKEHFDDPYYLANILNKLTIYKLHLNEDIRTILSSVERFRLLDMVFPSPRNLITKTCLICLMRFAYANKIRLREEFLTGLSKYPNYIELRVVAIEALFLFHIETVEFRAFVGDRQIVVAVLKIIIKMVELGFRSIRVWLKQNYNDILDAYRPCMGLEESEYFEIVLGKHTVNEHEYLQQKVFEINYALEHKQGISKVVERVLGSKKIVLRDFVKLRKMVFARTLKLRLPLVKEEQIEEYENRFKICLKYTKYRPINEFKGVLLRLRTHGIIIRYRNCDIPFLIMQGIRANKSFTGIEKYLRSLKHMEKYDTDALPIRRTEEEYTRERMIVTHMEQKQGGSNKHYTLANFLDSLYSKSIRFVFLCIPITSKVYLGCKNMVSVIEKTLYQHSTIQKTVTLLDEVTRKEAIDFVTGLLQNEKYSVFRKMVDTEDYKNYNDVIRTPMCLERVLEKLVINDDLKGVKYQTCDCLCLDLRRIPRNGLQYNLKNSEIHHTAEILQEEINMFISQHIQPKPTRSKRILAQMFKKHDTKNFDLEIDLGNVRTWEDLDNELTEIKKKYSRYSQNGRMLGEKLLQVRQEIEGTFFVANGRITNIDE
ncbi:TAF2 [Enterospora canceri]|uniref:TAF2 n=1 Tax=Enterospora canceri TaxID=1081671 RepID=A0A1Y1S976_9MICR|nr:TAF2 [Enterospora canceri]